MRCRLFNLMGIAIIPLVYIPRLVFLLLFLKFWPVAEAMGRWRWVIWAVVMCLFVGADRAIMRRARRFVRQQQERTQAQRDQEAKQLLELLQQNEVGAQLEGELPVFFFWFRPFHVADQLPFRLSFSELALYSNIELPDRMEWDLETIVASALHRYGVVVSLGKAGRPPRAGRIVIPDEDWKATVELLGPLASAFFVLPSFRPGTVWEVHWLKTNGRLEDSVFIMPSLPAFKKRQFDLATYWRNTRHRLHDVVLLPEYDPIGMLIWLANDGAIRRTRRLKLGLSQFRRALPDRTARPWSKVVQKTPRT